MTEIETTLRHRIAEIVDERIGSVAARAEHMAYTRSKKTRDVKERSHPANPVGLGEKASVLRRSNHHGTNN